MIGELLAFGVILFVGVTTAPMVATSWRTNGHGRHVLEDLRWWMVPAGVASLVSGLAIAAPLITHPILGWSWWRLLGGNGNAMLGQTSYASPVFTVSSVLIPMIIVLAIPSLAASEEELFRQGSQHRTSPRRLVIALGFGLTHLTVGVPLIAVFSLTWIGLYYTVVYVVAYRRAHTKLMKLRDFAGDPQSGELPWDQAVDVLAARRATRTSTAAHALNNWMVVGVVLLVLVVNWFA